MTSPQVLSSDLARKEGDECIDEVEVASVKTEFRNPITVSCILQLDQRLVFSLHSLFGYKLNGGEKNSPHKCAAPFLREQPCGVQHKLHI